MIELTEVEKTLLLPLCARYYLSKIQGLDFHDEVAIRLMESKPLVMERLLTKLNQLECCYFLDRSLTMDVQCWQFIRAFPEGRIIHVGAGLDNPFERNDNGLIRWYDLDMPDVITLRHRVITRRPRQSCISSSVFDYEWMEELNPEIPTLLLFPGVLNYFELEQVMTLLDRVNQYFHICSQVMDVMSDRLSRYIANKTVKKVGVEQAKIRWQLNEKFKHWPASIKTVRFEPFYTQIPRALTLKKRTQFLLRLTKAYRYLQYCIASNQRSLPMRSNKVHQ